MAGEYNCVDIDDVDVGYAAKAAVDAYKPKSRIEKLCYPSCRIIYAEKKIAYHVQHVEHGKHLDIPVYEYYLKIKCQYLVSPDIMVEAVCYGTVERKQNDPLQLMSVTEIKCEFTHHFE